MSAEELKPCPFCGQKAKLVRDPSDHAYWIVCCQNGDCSVMPDFRDISPEFARRGWNRRPSISLKLAAEQTAVLNAVREWMDAPVLTDYPVPLNLASKVREVCARALQEADRG